MVAGACIIGRFSALSQRTQVVSLKRLAETHFRVHYYRISDSYDDILNACKTAWNWLIADPARIQSIGTRNWAVC